MTYQTTYILFEVFGTQALGRRYLGVGGHQFDLPKETWFHAGFSCGYVSSSAGFARSCFIFLDGEGRNILPYTTPAASILATDEIIIGGPGSFLGEISKIEFYSPGHAIARKQFFSSYVIGKNSIMHSFDMQI